MQIDHNSLTAIPRELTTLTAATAVSMGYNYLDCDYVKLYMTMDGVVCDNQYCLCYHIVARQEHL